MYVFTTTLTPSPSLSPKPTFLSPQAHRQSGTTKNKRKTNPPETTYFSLGSRMASPASQSQLFSSSLCLCDLCANKKKKKKDKNKNTALFLVSSISPTPAHPSCKPPLPLHDNSKFTKHEQLQQKGATKFLWLSVFLLLSLYVCSTFCVSCRPRNLVAIIKRNLVALGTRECSSHGRLLSLLGNPRRMQRRIVKIRSCGHRLCSRLRGLDNAC